MAEIRSLNALRAARQDDNRLVTPVEVLEDAAEDIRNGKTKATSLVAVALDAGESGEEYEIELWTANMKSAEILALLEVAKTAVLRHMKFIPEP